MNIEIMHDNLELSNAEKCCRLERGPSLLVPTHTLLRSQLSNRRLGQRDKVAQCHNKTELDGEIAQCNNSKKHTIIRLRSWFGFSKSIAVNCNGFVKKNVYPEGD